MFRTAPARPNTAIPAQRQRDFAPPLPLASTGFEQGGQWVVNKEVMQQMLWHEFSGRQFEWTLKGKSVFGYKTQAAANEALDLMNVDVDIKPKYVDKYEEVWEHLDDDLKGFLAVPLGAVQDTIRNFIFDIGFSIPLLSTIKSAVMLGYTAWGANKTRKKRKQAAKVALTDPELKGLHSIPIDQINVNAIDDEIGAINQELKVKPLFELAQSSIIVNCSRNLHNDIVNIGGYAFDLVTSVAGPVSAAVNVSTAIGRLIWKLRHLYKTWQVTHAVNNVLKGHDRSALMDLFNDNSLLGCYILNMPERVIAGHFNSADASIFNPKEQTEILRLLGVDENIEKAQREKIDRLRDSAQHLIKNAPYQLSDKVRLPFVLPDDDSDVDSI